MKQKTSNCECCASLECENKEVFFVDDDEEGCSNCSFCMFFTKNRVL